MLEVPDRTIQVRFSPEAREVRTASNLRGGRRQR